MEVTREEFEGIREEVASLRRRLQGVADRPASREIRHGDVNPLSAEHTSLDAEEQKLGTAAAAALECVFIRRIQKYSGLRVLLACAQGCAEGVSGRHDDRNRARHSDARHDGSRGRQEIRTTHSYNEQDFR